MAAFDQSWPKQFDVQLHTWGALQEVVQTKAVCVLKFEQETVYIQFPTFGGVRLKNDYEGFFTPDGLRDIAYTETDGIITASAEDAAVRIAKDGGITIANADGVPVLVLAADAVQYGENGLDARTVICFPKDADEAVYGFGERFNAFDQSGHTLPLWNVDTIYHVAPAEGDKVESYQNVPMFHSTKGYAFFYNCAANAVADLSDGFTLTVDSRKFDCYVFVGTPLQNIRAYTDLTGKPLLPPRWAFRYWAGAGASIWRKRGDADEAVLGVLQDCFDKYNEIGTGLPTLYAEFPVPFIEESFQKAAENGTKLLMWVRPNVAKANMKNILGETDERKLPVTDTLDWLRVKDCVDYSHPKAVDIIKGVYEKQWSWGLKGSMIDFGEYWPWRSAYYNGMDGNEMHNFSTYYYNKAMHDAWHDAMGDDYITFSRSACAGSQRWSACFGGDEASTWFGLEQVVYGILSLSSCGFSFWGSDLGGFFGTPSTDIYCRWLEFSTFSPLMRAHGIITSKDPWNFGDAAVSAFRKYFALRESLLDTLYSAAVHASRTGEPMLKALAVAFPQEDALRNIGDQYLFCDSLLVAPVIKENVTSREVILPRGEWFCLWNGTKYTGDTTITMEVPQDHIPVFVKGNALLPVNVDASGSLTALEGEKTAVYLVTPHTERKTHVICFENRENTITVGFENGVLTVNGDVDRPVMPFGFTPDAVIVNGEIGGAFGG